MRTNFSVQHERLKSHVTVCPSLRPVDHLYVGGIWKFILNVIFLGYISPATGIPFTQYGIAGGDLFRQECV